MNSLGVEYLFGDPSASEGEVRCVIATCVFPTTHQPVARILESARKISDQIARIGRYWWAQPMEFLGVNDCFWAAKGGKRGQVVLVKRKHFRVRDLPDAVARIVRTCSEIDDLGWRARGHLYEAQFYLPSSVRDGRPRMIDSQFVFSQMPRKADWLLAAELVVGPLKHPSDPILLFKYRCKSKPLGVRGAGHLVTVMPWWYSTVEEARRECLSSSQLDERLKEYNDLTSDGGLPRSK